MKKLRFTYPNRQIGMFVTGEYGEQKKRPHWHAILFNWRPSDGIHAYTNGRGDKVYHSETLSKMWGKGLCDFGEVTIESAGYCARYAAKKLVHGKDADHDYYPISKKSSKHAIGKKFLEQYWPDIFNYGYVQHQNEKLPIPRYYEKWLQKHQPERWLNYVETTKQNKIQCARSKTAREELDYKMQLDDNRRNGKQFSVPITQNEQRRKIAKINHKLLQERLKL